MRKILCITAVFALAVWANAAAQDLVYEPVLESMGSLPGGVVVEGGAGGMEALETLEYDKDKNEFIINAKTRYANPVSRKDFAKVLKSILKEDNLGVTLVEGQARAYGDISTGSQTAEDLLAADKLIGGIVYGFEHLLTGVKLPGDYKPVKTEGRAVPVVAFTVFKEFQYEKKDNTYVRAGATMQTILVPMSKERSASGGYLPDEKLAKTFVPDAGDQKNMDHLKTHQQEYFKMPVFAKALVWGEVAAFARHIRDSKVDGQAFLKLIK